MKANTPQRNLRSTILLILLLTAMSAIGPWATLAEDKPWDPDRQKRSVVELDRWYRVLIQDQPSGYMHVTSVRDPKTKEITSTTQIKITIKRGQVPLSIGMGSKFVETVDGKPIRAVSTQKMGPTAVIQTIHFQKDGIKLTTEQGGQTQTKMLPLLEGPWLTPAAASRFVKEQLDKGIKKFTYRSIDPTTGPKLIESKVTIAGRKNIEVMGKTVPAIEVHEEQSILPGQVVHSYIDLQGVPLRMSVPMIPGMNMTIIAADRDIAMGKVQPQELLVRSMVTPDRSITQPRALKRAVFQLQFEQDKAGGAKAMVKLPQAGYQSAKWLDENLAQVTIDLSKAIKTENDSPTDVHRQASTMLNSNDPKVKALTAEAIKDQAANLSVDAKARLITQYVRKYIKNKDLGVALATASDVAQTAQGDCTEHAVLLAAMLRVEGIPSRAVTGLVYVENFAGKKNIFGYHMWTQAWFKDKGQSKPSWVDLDAAMPGKFGTFDATHIALSNNAMDDESGFGDMVTASAVIGRLSIKVIEPGK
jgi:hypothetical protein